MNNYYESLKTDIRNDYLTTQPTKRAALENAALDGKVSILNNSNNRAVIIDTDNYMYLQSYDTLILSYDKVTGRINKLWDGYSVTTLKHINTFMNQYFNKAGFNKKEWTEFKRMVI